VWTRQRMRTGGWPFDCKGLGLSVLREWWPLAPKGWRDIDAAHGRLNSNGRWPLQPEWLFVRGLAPRVRAVKTRGVTAVEMGCVHVL